MKTPPIFASLLNLSIERGFHNRGGKGFYSIGFNRLKINQDLYPEYLDDSYAADIALHGVHLTEKLRHSRYITNKRTHIC